jgi:acyl dehydratase
VLKIDGGDALRDYVGKELGVSDWRVVDQEAIDDFARLTGDDYWPHVDPVRAAPAFGGTIAHGLYTLSLGPSFCYAMYEIQGFSQELNYGYGKVRFPAPLLVDSRIRMRATLQSAEMKREGRLLTRVNQVYECEGATKPVCVAESLYWYVP